MTRIAEKDHMRPPDISHCPRPQGDQLSQRITFCGRQKTGVREARHVEYVDTKARWL
jgi:hypothetical protein